MIRRTHHHPGSDPPGAPRPGEAEPGHTGNEPPPILGSWKTIYLLVLGELVALIALFYLFTKTFE